MTEVGRQPWIVYEVDARRGRGDRRRRASGRATSRWSLVYIVAGRDRLLAAAPPGARPTRVEVAGRSGTDGRGLRGVRDHRDHRLRGARRRRLRRGLLGPDRPADQARRAGARHDPAFDGPGLGGQPRLADLRAGRSCGRRSRVFFGSIMSTLYVPLFIAALGIILRGVGVRACAARRRPIGRGAAARRAVRVVVRAHPVLPRRGAGRRSRPAGCRSATRSAARWSSWLNPTSIFDRGDRRGDRRVSRRGLSGGRRRARGACPTWSAFRVTRARCRCVAGRSPIGGLVVVRSDSRAALRRADLRRRVGVGLAVGGVRAR